jgi:hypothetical protein
VAVQETFILPKLLWSAQNKIFFFLTVHYVNLCVPSNLCAGSRAGPLASECVSPVLSRLILKLIPSLCSWEFGLLFGSLSSNCLAHFYLMKKSTKMLRKPSSPTFLADSKVAGLQTQNAWFAQFLKAGLSEKRPVCRLRTYKPSSPKLGD